jgi:ribosome-binding factor A
MRGEPSRRVERLNELLRDEISDLIRRELRDPRLAGLISITQVETAGDLSSAKVFISVLGSEEDRKAALAALRGATGFFRHMLLPRLRLRRVPDLVFRADISLERGDRVLRLLKQIAAEDEARESGTTSTVEESRSEEAPAPRREE